MIDVAHELQYPLTNIRGYLEALTTALFPVAEIFRRASRHEVSCRLG